MRKGKKDKKETTGMLQCLSLKISRKLLKIAGGRMSGKESVEDGLRLLNTGADVEEKLELYYARKISLVIKVLFGGCILALLAVVSESGASVLTEGYYLTREDETYDQELVMVTEEKGEESVTVEVEPRVLSTEESRALLEETIAEMESYILGENSSLDEVRSDLNLVEEIEGTPVTIDWDMDTYEALNMDGSLRIQNLTEEGTLVVLTARLTCDSEEAVYQAAAKIYPPVPSEEEEWQNAVEEALAASQEESSGLDMMALPESIAGMDVSWKDKASALPAAMLLLTVVCAVAVFMGGDSDLKKEVKNREVQMEMDYARIVSKLVLLTGAGATVRTAWETIVRDYRRKRDSGLEGSRYAFEEMALACREMENGVAETKAYENFGSRCRVPSYLKLAALLEQNIRKGSKGLSQMLGAEIRDAFEQRKAAAVKRGEEASTKLLAPMMMLLAVVMILIMVPAGMSMQV